MNRNTNVGFVDVPYPGTKLLVPGYVGSTNPWDADPGVLTDINTEGGGASLTVNQDLPFARLVSISAYRQLYNFDHNLDVAAGPSLAQYCRFRPTRRKSRRNCNSFPRRARR